MPKLTLREYLKHQEALRMEEQKAAHDARAAEIKQDLAVSPPDFPKYCTVNDSTMALGAVRKWSKTNRTPPQFVALEQVGGLFLTVVTDGTHTWYGTQKGWLDEKTEDTAYAGLQFHTKHIETQLKKMFKEYEGVSARYMILYGEWFGTGVSAPLIKSRDLNIMDIALVDDVGWSLLSHTAVQDECKKFDLRVAQEVFSRGTFDELIVKCKLDTITMSRINTDMTVHGVYFKPVDSRPRSVPIIPRISLCCKAFPVAARFDAIQTKAVGKLMPLITSKRVYDIMSHIQSKLTANDVGGLSTAVIVDCTQEIAGPELFEGLSKEKQKQMYDYLHHYTQSIVRSVFRANDILH